ncbi:MAG: hypothetical protein MHM6MM_001444 [Cercozoa sp. M6MM]
MNEVLPLWQILTISFVIMLAPFLAVRYAWRVHARRLHNAVISNVVHSKESVRQLLDELEKREAKHKKLENAPQKRVLRDPALFFCVAGNGSGVLSAFSSVAGASKVLLGGEVSYSRSNTEHLLCDGEDAASAIASFASVETAQRLAKVALKRAIFYSNSAVQEPVGVGVTAALSTSVPRRGNNRAHVTVATRNSTRNLSLTFARNMRDRFSEEHMLVSVVTHAVTKIIESDALFDLCDDSTKTTISFDSVDLLPPDKLVLSPPICSKHPLDTLFEYEQPHFVQFLSPVSAHLDTFFGGATQTKRLIVCGSFAPLHDGHLALARAALSQSQALYSEPHEVIFEIGAENADKQAIGTDELRKRIVGIFAGTKDGFTDCERVSTLVSRHAPYFLHKARLYPNSCFVIGGDTLQRLVDPKYYGSCDKQLSAAFAEIKALGCAFLVAFRSLNGHDFVCSDIVEHCALPETLRDIFIEIPRAKCDIQISSTQLRAQAVTE